MKSKLVKLSKVAIGFGSTLALPLVALAQIGSTGNPGGTALRCSNVVTGTQVNNIQEFICKLNDILTAIIPFLIALGIVYFVWGVISYVIGNDEEAKKKGRDRMIYGIIGLVVIIAVWGIVRWVTSTFDVDNTGTITIPAVGY
jgi:phosphotransferase system  glucose/maltose/N-acetylglucosamine-specific IIC component